MISQTGIIRSYNPFNQTGLITSDLGGDIRFSAAQVSEQDSPASGSLVSFILDDSEHTLQAVKIRFI
ncbi:MULTISPECIES: hypothetical protein [Photobacterium]|uniref:CSD domain-containing protein n=1 Tax=Photobacterium ganghwense TaxID=320778 RepID=A0A0J1H9F9_9GAMM|nr:MULTISPECIES: hypothetical protein [Photobacterium]KLV08338.1 hypothetical protein ABT57_16295 [Photobacterium ganghwense]MBV1841068.1 hypothetical protein [Photobacterium ganghwense]PSU07472.1 hypothetical protein C9I92_17345 [Photobacterium ganghwense]QSV16208.1 hypothetical protein FH974_23595 [Photobacterium ganghwense]